MAEFVNRYKTKASIDSEGKIIIGDVLPGHVENVWAEKVPIFGFQNYLLENSSGSYEIGYIEVDFNGALTRFGGNKWRHILKTNTEGGWGFPEGTANLFFSIPVLNTQLVATGFGTNMGGAASPKVGTHDSLAIGMEASVGLGMGGSIAVGTNAIVDGPNSVAIGTSARAESDRSVSARRNHVEANPTGRWQSWGDGGVAIGGGAVAYETGVAIGYQCSAGESSIALGSNYVSASGKKAIAIGANADPFAIAIGLNPGAVGAIGIGNSFAGTRISVALCWAPRTEDGSGTNDYLNSLTGYGHNIRPEYPSYISRVSGYAYSQELDSSAIRVYEVRYTRMYINNENITSGGVTKTLLHQSNDAPAHLDFECTFQNSEFLPRLVCPAGPTRRVIHFLLDIEFKPVGVNLKDAFSRENSV